jgi:hypothetical protein
MIVLDPGNPHDFTDGGLEILRDELAQEFNTSVMIDRREEHGQGVTFIEILHVWMEIGEVASTGLLATRLGAWLLARRHKEAKETDRPRPRSANLFGPDGELLKTVLVEDDEPVVGDPEAYGEWSRPRPKPPSLG